MRRKTNEVRIGELTLSSERPVAVQSMLNTPTMDTKACVEQAIRIIKAGGELVRITAQGVKEAENLRLIRDELRRRGYTTPLSADIHFNPEAAIVAAKYVEKVRINPGNFVDKRATFKQIDYTEAEYAEALAALHGKFKAFLEVCRDHHTAVRIGTNHGSLSDRIMSRYGDTPEGMVEATMEFLRVCKDEAFDDVVISLKASGCAVMVKAVRLLVSRMEEEGMAYPLHLGVTEAGEGEDGEIRSAVGIGCLLNEGIGDTVRVSLTGPPENEVPVAMALVRLCVPQYENRRETEEGENRNPFVVGDFSGQGAVGEAQLSAAGFRCEGEAWSGGRTAPEVVYAEAVSPLLGELPQEVTVVVPSGLHAAARRLHARTMAYVTACECVQEGLSTEDVWVEVADEKDAAEIKRMHLSAGSVVVVRPRCPDYHKLRSLWRSVRRCDVNNPVVVRVTPPDGDASWRRLWTGAHLGGLFIDRLVAGLWISMCQPKEMAYGLRLSRDILQAVGLRRYRAEFVSCPGCGRTLYDLEKAVAGVKAAFAHLDRLKIAVMGCVVNGPGEMGDADYGYVGAGNGKVNLYRGRQMVRVAVPEGEAIAALEAMIREDGNYVAAE